MISAQDKQAILDGAYGVTRKGNKVKFLFKSDVNQAQNRYLFAEYVESNGEVDFHNSLWLSEDFTFYINSRKEHNLDVIGLWKDKPEPFDLERALAGEPLIDLHNNEKCWLYKSHKNGDLITEYENTYSHLENIEPLEYLQSGLDLSKCFGMWVEPEEQINTFPVPPKALKEPKEDMWFISIPELQVRKSSFTTKDTNIVNNTMFNLGLYFDSKEKAEAMLHFLKNNKE